MLVFPPWSEWSGSYILVPHCDEGSGLPHLSLCPRVWCTCRTHSWGTPSLSCWRWCPSLPAYDHCRYVCTAAHCILPRSGEIERFVKQNIRKWKLTASKKNESKQSKYCFESLESTVILTLMSMQQKVAWWKTFFDINLKFSIGLQVCNCV